MWRPEDVRFPVISVVHTDLPGNDFSSLFKTLDADPESYFHVDSATFASAAGRSFYRQILPSGSVTLGWSSWAVQWLSRTPAPISDHLHVAYSRDTVARALRTPDRQPKTGGRFSPTAAASSAREGGWWF
jgi:hypothetical protein